MKQPLHENKSLPTEKPVESSDAETGNAKVRNAGNAKVRNLSIPSVPEILWAALYLQARPKRL